MRRLMAFTLVLGAACLDCSGESAPIPTGGTSSGSTATSSGTSGTSSSGSSSETSSGSSSSSSSSGTSADAATLTAIQSTIFAGSCTGTTCHGSAGRGGLKLTDTATSCANLVGVAVDDSSSTPQCATGGAAAAGMKRVVAGDPAASFLYQKIASTDDCVQAGVAIAGERMPKGRGPLSAAQIARIEQWIKSGASCD